MKTQSVQLNYLRLAPRKVRLVVSAIKNMSVSEAEAFLTLNPRRATGPVLKLLRSAISAAKEQKMDIEKLVIKDARVDGGPMLKRFMPRAQGRATSIEKKTSHVFLTLVESEKVKKSRFNFVKKSKKQIVEDKNQNKSAEDKEKEAEKPKKIKAEKGAPKGKEKGFTTKVHQRKAI